MAYALEILFLFSAGAPLLFALALATSPRVSVRSWLQVIATVSVAELTILGFSRLPPDLQLYEILTMSVLLVLFPWAVSALFLWGIRYPIRHILVACAFPFVYFISFVFGLAAVIRSN
ncbi:MAG: hypothetical protein AABY73_07725 [Pseudomonadota bacterium]